MATRVLEGIKKNSEEDHGRNISVKFHLNRLSTFREEDVLKKVITQTDGRMTDNRPRHSSLAYGQWSQKCDWKIEICFGKVRKHCWKRRKCWLPAFFSFPTMFSKGFLYRVVKSQDCVVKSKYKLLELVSQSMYNKYVETKLKEIDANTSNLAQVVQCLFHIIGNIMGKGENAGYQYFLPFSTMFSKDCFSGVFKTKDCLV